MALLFLSGFQRLDIIDNLHFCVKRFLCSALFYSCQWFELLTGHVTKSEGTLILKDTYYASNSNRLEHVSKCYENVHEVICTKFQFT